MRIAEPWLLLLILVPSLLLAASTESNEPGPSTAPAVTAEDTLSDMPIAQPRPDPSELAQRALEIEAREAALRELESVIEQRIEELQRSQQAALQVLEPERQQQEADLAKLVAFYQSMKPKSAAELLEKLPLELATSVLSRMKQREAGKILNVMDDARAVQISKRMADLNP